jgi:DNA-binding NarL/FixJ family response regulator
MNRFRIRIAIADDHQMIRIGLEKIIAFMEDMSLVAQFPDATEVLQADLGGVDVLILDMNMPGSDGFTIIGSVTSKYPELKIVVFSMLPEESFAPRALASGAAAFLNKNRPPEEVVTAIRAVMKNGQYLFESQAVMMSDLETTRKPPHESLSQREFEIFILIAGGKKPTAIAQQLDLKIGTVTTHIHRVKRKLGVHSLGEMVAYGHRHNLLGA